MYRTEGVAAYARYQMAHEDEPLAPGDAFHLVRKLLRINTLLDQYERVEVILLSRNTADTGLRVFKSIAHHELPIRRAAFTGGAEPYKYMRPFGCHLFLSTNQQDVIDALGQGIAAASILSGPDKPSRTMYCGSLSMAMPSFFQTNRSESTRRLGSTASSPMRRRPPTSP